MDDLRRQLDGLWEDFKTKKFSAQDAKVHLTFGRVIIETFRVDIATEKLRMLTARPVDPLPPLAKPDLKVIAKRR